MKIQFIVAFDFAYSRIHKPAKRENREREQKKGKKISPNAHRKQQPKKFTPPYTTKVLTQNKNTTTAVDKNDCNATNCTLIAYRMVHVIYIIYAYVLSIREYGAYFPFFISVALHWSQDFLLLFLHIFSANTQQISL